MAQTLYNLTCFLIGDKTIFKVEIDSAKEVGNLKNAIKQQKQAALKDVDADKLTLDRVTINRSLEPEARIHELQRLSNNSSECTPLGDDMRELSDIFDKTPPAGQVYLILVRIREGESIYCGGVVLMAVVR